MKGIENGSKSSFSKYKRKSSVFNFENEKEMLGKGISRKCIAFSLSINSRVRNNQQIR